MADTASTPSAKPVKAFDKNDLRVSIFENERTNSKTGQPFTVRTVKLTRSYQQGGSFRRTSSLRPQDLLDAIAALQEADAYLNQQQEQ